MPQTREQIKTAAMQLAPAERESLAEELLLSLSDSECSNIDAAWLAEAYRRDTGDAAAIPVEEVIERLHNRARL